VTERSVWLRIGWRNLGRHRRRSVITAAALAWGFAAVVVLSGIMQGLATDFVRSGTDLVVGQLRVQNPAYEPARELWDVVGADEGIAAEALVQRLLADPDVVGAAPRVYGSGIVASDVTSRGGLLMGIVPEREAGVTRFLAGLERGRAPGAGRREVVLGVELARQLQAGVGDVVVLVTPAADGSLGNELFEVTGLLRTGLVELDTAQAVLYLDDLQDLLALRPGAIHEIVAAVRNPGDAVPAARRLAAALADLGPGVRVAAWPEYRPELVQFSALLRGAQWVILIVVFIMAAFGAANTMLMGTFERRREFAVMKALGMAPRHVLATVLNEAVVLGALALAAGALLALPAVLWLTYAPLDLTRLVGEVTFVETLFQLVLRVEHSWPMAIRGAVALLVTTVAAALYPAVRALRVPAAEALAGR
jgi:ABC-type lipoprotein release transport system permease subunit